MKDTAQIDHSSRFLVKYSTSNRAESVYKLSMMFLANLDNGTLSFQHFPSELDQISARCRADIFYLKFSTHVYFVNIDLTKTYILCESS